jgi:hypothetical protein
MPFKAGLNELSLAALSNWLLIVVSTFFDKAKGLKSQMRQDEIYFRNPAHLPKEINKTFILKRYTTYYDWFSLQNFWWQ